MKLGRQTTVGIGLSLLIAKSSIAAVHYVDATSDKPTPPYITWATAANTIQDAVDFAFPGDDIVVTNGVYAVGGRAVFGTMTNRVAVDKPVSVRSLNGPSVTIIQGYQVPGTTNGDDPNSVFNYSCTTPFPSTGTGNIDSDPRLASSTHLSLLSPCRFSGGAAYVSGLDIDGEWWASTPAIGCDELYPGRVTGPLSVSIAAEYHCEQGISRHIDRQNRRPHNGQRVGLW